MAAHLPGQLPVGLLVVLAGFWLIPRLESSRDMAIEWWGVGLFGLAITLVVLPMIEDRCWAGRGWTLVTLVAATPSGALFLRRQHALEAEGREQLLPMVLLRDRGFLSGVTVVMLHFSAIPGMFLVLAIYFQTGFGLTRWNRALPRRRSHWASCWAAMSRGGSGRGRWWAGRPGRGGDAGRDDLVDATRRATHLPILAPVRGRAFGDERPGMGLGDLSPVQLVLRAVPGASRGPRRRHAGVPADRRGHRHCHCQQPVLCPPAR